MIAGIKTQWYQRRRKQLHQLHDRFLSEEGKKIARSEVALQNARPHILRRARSFFSQLLSLSFSQLKSNGLWRRDVPTVLPIFFLAAIVDVIHVIVVAVVAVVVDNSSTFAECCCCCWWCDSIYNAGRFLHLFSPTKKWQKSDFFENLAFSTFCFIITIHINTFEVALVASIPSYLPLWRHKYQW